MDGSDINVLSLAEQRMTWLDDRQRVLAQNIANVDTPGFQPTDLAAFSSHLAATASPARTDPRHLPGRHTTTYRTDKERESERAPDGNAVSVEHELTKIADTETSHQLATDLYKKYMGMFLTALGKS